MRKSVLILMIDVLVLSVLTLTVDQIGGGSAGMVLPAHRWSSVIKQGLQREQELLGSLDDLQAKLAEEKRRAEQAAQLAQLALENQKAEREDTSEAQVKIEALNEQLGEAVDQARSAQQRAELSAEKARQAEQQAREAREREQNALAKLSTTEESARAAEARALQAMEKEKAAVLDLEKVRETAQAAAERAVDARARESDALQRAEAMLKEARSLEKQTVRSTTQAELAQEAVTRAVEQEQQAREKIELALAREGAALERARIAEVERGRALEEIRSSQERVMSLREELSSTSVKEQLALNELEHAEATIGEFEEELNRREEERTRSVWVQREKAIRLLQAVMVEYRRDGPNNRRRESIYVPLVKAGGFIGVISEFDSLGFGLSWWTDQIDQDVSSLAFSLSPISTAENDETLLLKKHILVPEREPRVCYVETPQQLAEHAVPAFGMARLREERLQSALLFKKDSANEQMEVSITPIVGTDYLVVRKTGVGARGNPGIGDYIMSEQGDFIGVMISKAYAYVVPTEIDAHSQATRIPLYREPGESYYRNFAAAVNETRKRIKNTERFPARSL